MENDEQRLSRALQAVACGNFSGALRDFETVFRNPASDDTGQYNRRVVCLFCWANMGALFPPARDCLTALVGAKLAHLHTNPGDAHTRADLHALQRALYNAQGIDA